MIANLGSSHILVQLAITLLHFLWQGVVIAALLALFLKIVPKHKVVLRYGASLTALASCLLVMVVTFYGVADTAISASELHRQVLVFADESTASTQSQYGISDAIYQYLPYLSLAYLCGLLFYTLKLVYELKRVRSLRGQGVQPAEGALQLKIEQLARQIGLSRAPQLLISLKAKTPMAIGILKPVVLLPFTMATNLTSQQIEMLLLHELAHIRRHDYAVNLLQSIAELVLFYHPAVRWISTQVRNEREYCSDDVALHHCQNPLAYAHTLADTAELCRHHHHIPQMAVAASGGDLKGRIERIVAHRCSGGSKLAQLQFASFLPVIVASWVLVGSLSQLTLPSIKTTPFTSTSDMPNQPAKAAELTSDLYQQEAIPPAIISRNEVVSRKAAPVVVESKPAVKLQQPSEFKLEPKLAIEPALNKDEPKVDVSDNANIVLAEKNIVDTSKPKTQVLKSKVVTAQKAEPKRTVTTTQEQPQPKVLIPSRVEQEQLKAPVDVFIEPEVMRTTQPVYPRFAKRKRIESSVKVSYTIDEQGRVTNMSFSGGVGQRSFRNAVKDALLKWRYKPAQLNGEPIATQMTKIFEFNLT